MENNKPLVSVIMNCYNSDTYLGEAIDSVISQTYKNWEIIFWDNQSTDKSAEIVKSYDDERIKYFYAPSFTSLYEARNYAIEKANGEYIAFLDCDDKWYNNKLKEQLKVLENCEYNLCYSNFYNLYENKLKKAFSSIQPSGDIFKYQIANYSIGILTVMLRKSAWDNMKEKFDKNFTYPGDLDFFIRFLHKNQAIYIDEPLAIYRADNPNSISNTKRESNLNELKKALDKIDILFKNEKIDSYINVAYAKLDFHYANLFFKNKKYISFLLKIFKIIFLNFKSINNYLKIKKSEKI